MHIRWNNILRLIAPAFLAIFIMNCNEGFAQETNDTLTLENVIAQVIQNNPIIKKANEGITSSELATDLAASAWLPSISSNDTYTRMAPIPAFNIPEFGHIQLYPDNGMNFSLEAEQLIYDFGKTGNKIEIQKINQDLASLSCEQVKEKFSMASAGIFYALFFIQSAKGIIEEHLNTLQKHLEFVKNRQKTGSATQYEILSTKVRVSSAETHLSELQTAYNVQLSHLNAIMGTELNNVFFYSDTTITHISEMETSVFEDALSHRFDVLLLEKKKAMNEVSYNLIKSQEYPTLGFIGTGGWKNGFLPEIEKLKLNYMIGLSLKFPVFDRHRNAIKLEMATSTIKQTDFELDNIKYSSKDEITESYLQLVLSEKKISQADLQLQQAEEAYYHAEINYKEGVLTNLDLIYASDMLANSQLQLLKNKIDYRYNLLKYRDALGEKIY